MADATTTNTASLSGLSTVGDGLLPALESKVSFGFSLGRVIANATSIFADVALVLAGLQKAALARLRPHN